MSGTTFWRPIVDEVLTEAWERCGKDPVTLTGTVARSARRSLQLAMIHWSNKGLRLWQILQDSVSLSANVALYQLPADTVDVLEAWFAKGGIDRILSPLSRDEYAAISQKLTPGEPTQFWIERILPEDPVLAYGGPAMHVYPVPTASGTIKVNRIRQPYDVVEQTEQLDVPALWGEAIITDLAWRLAVKFVPERVEGLKLEAAEAYAACQREWRERVPTRILPRFR